MDKRSQTLMDTATSRPPALQVFEDALGTRHHADAPGGEPLEVLELHDCFNTDAFEATLRERVTVLTGFHSTWFSQVRTVQRITQNASKLFVVFDRVHGARLSTVLEFARHEREPLEVNATLCLIRQLVAAIALLHEKLPTVAHGAISAERIIITPKARLVVTDHVLGLALENLGYASDQYWNELRVPLPNDVKPTFDQRADVMQIGIFALELILGRPIERDEYPVRIHELTEDAWSKSAATAAKPLPPELRTWLLRMLQLDAQPSFASAVDAWEELEQVLGGSDNRASFLALESVMTAYTRRAADLAWAAAGDADEQELEQDNEAEDLIDAMTEEADPLTMPEPMAVAPAPITVAAAVVAPPAVAPPAVALAPMPAVMAPLPAAPRPGSSPKIAAHVPPSSARVVVAPPVVQQDKPAPPAPAEFAVAASAFAPPTPEANHTMSPSRRRWIAAAAVVVVLGGTGAMFGRRLLMPPASAEAPGTLVVNTNPAGFQVFVDGQPRGVSPITVELAPGSHELRIATEGEPRIIPFTVMAGNTVSQTIELPKAAPSTGQLTIRTEPAGARVSIDGAPGGTTPLTLDGLAPGLHSVVLSNDLSSVTQEVNIEPGTTASLVVPMSAPEGVPVSGWIAVEAPAAVQVYEAGRLLGTSQTDRIMVSAGRHDFEIVSEALQYRTTRTVTVSPGKVSAMRLEWPKGSLSLNAQPWANVWVNGEPLGETPIGNVAVPIGTHEVVFRHPEFGEQVIRTTVTATAPARVTVDMRKR